VDGGQSTTTALIGDATGFVVGCGRGGPCNHVAGPEARQRFAGAIGSCVRAALAQAGEPEDRRSFQAACFGFSGGPADKEPLIREMFEIGTLGVTTDALIALSGAAAGRPGIIVIAGTGSIAFGRNSRCDTARAGGWGYVFGDEGGAFDITRQALRAALRQHEGWGPRTALHDRLLSETGARDANELLHRFYTPEFSRPRIAAMATIVDQAAREGDEVARKILESEAQALASFAGAVRARIFRQGEDAVVAHVGGVYRSDIVRERFRMLVELTGGNRCIEPVYGPAAGALLEAYRSAGLGVQLGGVPDTEK
jgi:N-acetylglucosamine kinase-like BadF-type ATPase